MKRVVLTSSLLSPLARRAVTSSPTPAPAQSELYSLLRLAGNICEEEKTSPPVSGFATKLLPAGLE